MGTAPLRLIVDRRLAPREEGAQDAAWQEERERPAGGMNVDAKGDAGGKGIFVHANSIALDVTYVLGLRGRGSHCDV